MKALSAAFCENFKAFGFLLKTPGKDTMKFYLYDVNDYFETVELDSEDYENEFTADISGCRDEDEETWNDEKVRETTEAQVKAHFGPSAVVVWEFR